MNNALNIPDKLKIGFQKRSDTYTGKLSYVTYINKKGETAKEKSWDGWRDKKIDILEIDNEPTEGFVLNKKAGGYSSGWNHRQTYCRVYDPRDFEFEISIENLLFILQECTSSKGKGLEGKFVYAWDGKDLVLLPVNSAEYRESKSLIEATEKITVKSLIKGASYKAIESDCAIYIGKQIWYNYEYVDSGQQTMVSKKYLTFYDVASEKYFFLKNTSHLYYCINTEECSQDVVSDYEDDFLNTSRGGLNRICNLAIAIAKDESEYYSEQVKRGNYYYLAETYYIINPSEYYVLETNSDKELLIKSHYEIKFGKEVICTHYNHGWEYKYTTSQRRLVLDTEKHDEIMKRFTHDQIMLGVLDNGKYINLYPSSYYNTTDRYPIDINEYIIEKF